MNLIVSSWYKRIEALFEITSLLYRCSSWYDLYPSLGLPSQHLLVFVPKNLRCISVCNDGPVERLYISENGKDLSLEIVYAVGRPGFRLMLFVLVFFAEFLQNNFSYLKKSFKFLKVLPNDIQFFSNTHSVSRNLCKDFIATTLI